MTLDNKIRKDLFTESFYWRLGRFGKAPDGVRSLLAGIWIGLMAPWLATSTRSRYSCQSDKVFFRGRKLSELVFSYFVIQFRKS